MYYFRHLTLLCETHGYDLYRFEKETIIRNLFCSCCFEKKLTEKIIEEG